ncbi:hypothetical protein JG687_00012020 [Phytophthora cactorum]|uniref:Uncharacterized protein n=1 Tax=Phytophthora cactorum TaxID=29920 RepID=A0A8T1U486_9STRA|nr:hypothetical protein JG687_00012020 [Phytophthora cactorum]
MPAWVKTNTKVVWAYDTPYCATPMADPTLAYQVIRMLAPPTACWQEVAPGSDSF